VLLILPAIVRNEHKEMSAKKSVHFAPGPAPQEYSSANTFVPPQQAQQQQPGPNMSGLAAGSSPFHLKQSPPFRTGGRGSKQLSKAIEHSTQEKINLGSLEETENVFLLHTGNPLYFAKYVSTNCQDPSSVLVQKMQPSHIDPALLVKWEGHLCIVKCERLQQIQMKKEPAGWRIVDTPMMKRIIADLKEQHGCSSGMPAANSEQSTLTTTPAKRKYDDWDYVSLESSDFDECSSRGSSSLFQSLGQQYKETTPAAEIVPLRQKMDIVVSNKQLMTISPGDDSIKLTPALVTSASEDGIKDGSGSGSGQRSALLPTLYSSGNRLPGILSGGPKDSKAPPAHQFSVQSPVPTLGLAVSSEPACCLSGGSDAALQMYPGGQPQARLPAGYPPYSSSSLYRTPSPRATATGAIGEDSAMDAGAMADLGVPILEELVAPSSGFQIISPDRHGTEHDTDAVAFADNVADNAVDNSIGVATEEAGGIGVLSFSSGKDVALAASTASTAASSAVAEGPEVHPSDQHVIPGIPVEIQELNKNTEITTARNVSSIAEAANTADADDAMADIADDGDNMTTQEYVASQTSQASSGVGVAFNSPKDDSFFNSPKDDVGHTQRPRSGSDVDFGDDLHSEMDDRPARPSDYSYAGISSTCKKPSTHSTSTPSPTPATKRRKIESSTTSGLDDAPARRSGQGLPPKPKQTNRNNRTSSREPPPVDSETPDPPPRRRAATQGSSYAQRNSFLGSWPSRKQSAANGTYKL
jgi:hypothetical protein